MKSELDESSSDVTENWSLGSCEGIKLRLQILCVSTYSPSQDMCISLPSVSKKILILRNNEVLVSHILFSVVKGLLNLCI